MYFVFVTKTRHNSVSRDKTIITGKEISKSFLCDYFTTHYSMVCRNVEKILKLIPQEGKMMDITYYEKYFHEYFK